MRKLPKKCPSCGSGLRVAKLINRFLLGSDWEDCECGSTTHKVAAEQEFSVDEVIREFGSVNKVGRFILQSSQVVDRVKLRLSLRIFCESCNTRHEKGEDLFSPEAWHDGTPELVHSKERMSIRCTKCNWQKNVA